MMLDLGEVREVWIISGDEHRLHLTTRPRSGSNTPGDLSTVARHTGSIRTTLVWDAGVAGRGAGAPSPRQFGGGLELTENGVRINPALRSYCRDLF